MNGEDWSETDYGGGARRAQSEKEEPHASHRQVEFTIPALPDNAENSIGDVWQNVIEMVAPFGIAYRKIGAARG
ncbi:hypothetical protein FPSE_09010 [Fusarium pseudograminearum CS3096]|uniref:Uncharacterized protein n=1 Tax=Fusarium pseudograminearum (strain CS3096) TaxID=1028729 RepID=K3VE62_FUSPC|nr:hypothetical protein FPSE_09010 [Fusarium pseudograminearum CS3096]EKJ70858.1 hypothetical protein FPSE_09010 [Fusarium pseudograminearum CS3096]